MDDSIFYQVFPIRALNEWLAFLEVARLIEVRQQARLRWVPPNRSCVGLLYVGLSTEIKAPESQTANCRHPENRLLPNHLAVNKPGPPFGKIPALVIITASPSNQLLSRC